MTDIPQTGLQLISLLKSSGELEVSLTHVPVPEPKENEVLVRIDATPINPSDLGLLFGPADIDNAKLSGTPDNPVLTAQMPEAVMRAMAARVDQPMPVGNEAGGVVVAAGSSPEAQALIGKTVGIIGGAMYAQYRAVKVSDCMVLPDGTTAAEGASCFVNPLTALAMTEVMKRENHTGLIHTAAASNLGQMLVKICVKDGIPLVNIVRNQAQADLLRSIGATHICDSSTPDFLNDLTAALVETGATIAFDAIGGGKLAGQILTCIEAAAVKRMKEYSRYGSDTFKQVYIYGALDTGPTLLNRNFGFSWAVNGFLLTPFLMQIGAEGNQRLRARVVAELKTTFASHYTREVSLAEMLRPDVATVYNKRATGEKFLVCPNKVSA
jgi:NADPH:quinone reductase